jgi:hypothetical protein
MVIYTDYFIPSAADAARLFKIHPATVSRLLDRTLPLARKAKHAA